MKKPILNLTMLCFLFLGLLACSSNDGEKTAKLQVWLTDAPGDFDEVNIDVQEIQVHVGGDSSESGWKSLTVNKGVYNLLYLTNGIDTLLGDVELPAGKISQIRVILGENNTVKVEGETHDLTTPSAQQSGLKVQVQTTLSAGITYKILLDFDAARSIVKTGSHKFILKPVIRCITTAQDGAIKGIVSPAASMPSIYAISNSDTVASTFSDSTGNFLIKGLAAGTYDVSFVPDSTYQTTEKTNVNVMLGVVTNLDTVKISH